MNGEHILRGARKTHQRVDRLLRIQSHCSIWFLIITFGLCICLAWAHSYDAAVAVFALSVGITGFLYNSVLQRELQIKDITDTTISTLRSRWDELRNDDAVLQLLTTYDPTQTYEPSQRLRLRLYLATVLDMYALIVHLIRSGYFSRTEEFASIYEDMIRSLFEYPVVIEVWRSKGDWGHGCLMAEYGDGFSAVVESIIRDIAVDRDGTKEFSGSSASEVSR